MKTIANRLIVFAASAIAFGAVAFGQTRMTAEIPFAFHTARTTLPAGTYEITDLQTGGNHHVVILWNTGSQKGTFAGNSMYNAYRTAPGRSVVEFACVEDVCSLKAIRTVSASLEYATPHKTWEEESAVISIPLETRKAD
jgi:hypothetical protein